MKQRLLALSAGLLLVAALLEVSLRIIGALHLSRAYTDQKSPAGIHHTILCLGDSFTFGTGVPRDKTYPAQLESLLNSGFKGGSFAVINRGVGAQNTAQLLAQLRHNIDTTRPDIVIVLTGGHNFWNYWGYGSYARRGPLMSFLHDQLYRIRVFLLAKLLFNNIKHKLVRPETIDPFSAAPELFGLIRGLASAGELERSSPGRGTGLAGHDGRGERPEPAATEAPASRCKGLTKPEIPGVARSLMEAANMDAFDVHRYTDVTRMHQERGDYEAAIECLKEAARLEPQELEKSIIYSRIGRIYVDLNRYDDAVHWLRQALDVNPSNYDARFTTAWMYMKTRSYENAIAWLKWAIKSNPYRRESYYWLGHIYRQTERYEEARTFFRQAARDNPDINEFADLFEKGQNLKLEILRWIEHDLEEIVRISKEYGLEVILQNYPGGNDANDAGILEIVAQKLSLPFVDNFGVFEKLLSSGAKKEDYFQPDGHCTVLGNDTMARNVYEKIVELGVFGPAGEL